MAQGDPKKWNMPGWRIEQKYSTKVLIGNWEEERLKVGFQISEEFGRNRSSLRST